jgi:hypothetical protein
MKKTVPDIKWLPPREEWDFRAVIPDECRMACHWEYSREIYSCSAGAIRNFKENATSKEAGREIKGELARFFCPSIYRQAARELFPQPWTSLTKEQRSAVIGSFILVPKLQAWKLEAYFERMKWAKDASAEMVLPLVENTYVIRPNFTLYGIEAVIKELATWARKEAKNHRQSPRAKAAELPFDALKWLAVLRLDYKRRQDKINFEKTQEAICEYRRKHPQADPNNVFPIYASHGAWSKAVIEASRCTTKTIDNPAHLLAGLV